MSKRNSLQKLLIPQFRYDLPWKLDNLIEFSSKVPSLFFSSMSQSKVSYLSKRPSITMSSILVLPWQLFWKDLVEKMKKTFFPRLSNINFSITIGYITSIKVSVDNFQSVKCYSTVQFCVCFLGQDVWHLEIVNSCIPVWTVFINRLVSFQNNLLDIFGPVLN